MSAEANKAVLRRLYEVFASGDLDTLDELLDPDTIDHASPGEPRGQTVFNGLKQWVESLHTAFPGFHWTVEDIIAEDDKVVARTTFYGTHQGEFMGQPGTGKQVTVRYIDIIRLENGKVTDHWGIADDLSLFQQLGMTSIPVNADI